MNDENSQVLSSEEALTLLGYGDLEVRGLLPGSSNYTFLAVVSNQQHQGLAIYKPSQGETPLWDFPHGTLCQRELAAYRVSEAVGWGLVPPTILRSGPYGRGAVQLFVDADFHQHYFTIRDSATHRQALQRIAVLDLVINNADRKGGHCLLDHQGRLWAIDHGVCFHAQSKLRTVIWDFAGQRLPKQIRACLADLRAQMDAGCELYQSLEELLSPGELRALARRTERLLASGVFPAADPHRRSYPWPLV